MTRSVVVVVVIGCETVAAVLRVVVVVVLVVEAAALVRFDAGEVATAVVDVDVMRARRGGVVEEEYG